MELKDYLLKEVDFPESVYIYEGESGEPLKLGRLNQYKDKLRLGVLAYNLEVGAETPPEASELIINEIIRAKYKELYGLADKNISDVSIEEILQTENEAENEAETPETGNVVIIQNDGQKITKTNYWQSEHAENGYFYVSVNAGCYRLLVPHSKQNEIAEMKTASSVVISRGQWNGKDAFEIMFEDNTSSPFCLYIVAAQWDRLPLDSDTGRKGVFHVYFGGEIVLRFDEVYYRKVEKLPCLKKVEK
jgi:hypothetical protein